MKKDVHRIANRSCFVDVSNDYRFLTRSTVKTKDTTKWEDGNEYPFTN